MTDTIITRATCVLAGEQSHLWDYQFDILHNIDGHRQSPQVTNDQFGTRRMMSSVPHASKSLSMMSAQA
jgi:hypothetical protein